MKGMAKSSIVSATYPLPVDFLNALAEMENHNKHLYRPYAYIHKWWAHRPGTVFRGLLISLTGLAEARQRELFYQGGEPLKGQVIFDPFMGSGTTLYEARRLGARVVGADINPVAAWVVRTCLGRVDIVMLEQMYQDVRKVVAPLSKFYETVCPHGCGKVPVLFWLWVYEAPCGRCRKPVVLTPSYVVEERDGGLLVACPQCSNLFQTEQVGRVKCPNCPRVFLPTQGTLARGRYRCDECQYEAPLLDAIAPQGKAIEPRLWVVRWLCQTHGQGWTPASVVDGRLFAEAKSLLQRKGDFGPRVRIPDGEKTSDLLRYGLREWQSLLNPRQRLMAKALATAILDLPSSPEREHLMVLWSATLEFNSAWCGFKGGAARRPGAVRHLFAHHAYVFPKVALENNFLGLDPYPTSGTFALLFRRRLVPAKLFSQGPGERVLDSAGRVRTVGIPGETACAETTTSRARFERGRPDALILCADSGQIKLSPQSVDAVVTDPPFFDNVMYGELSDFFYQWIRAALNGRHPWFRRNSARRPGEAVVAEAHGKGALQYAEALRDVWETCARALKPQAPLIFTFHHRDPEAWAAIAWSLATAGFGIQRVVFMAAEQAQSLHVRGQETPTTDAVLYCEQASVGGELVGPRLVTERLRGQGEDDLALGILPLEDAWVRFVGMALERCWGLNPPRVGTYEESHSWFRTLRDEFDAFYKKEVPRKTASLSVAQ